MQTQNANRKAGNIDEALHILDEEAHYRAGELSKLIRSDFRNLSKTLKDVTSEVPGVMDDLGEKSLKWFNTVKVKAKEASKDAVDSVDKSAHSHPWQYVGAAALVGGLLGFMAARKSQK